MAVLKSFTDQLTHPVFNTISDIASEKDQQAYVIGGFVRDLLLKRPCKDIDVVVTGSGIELAKEVSKRDGESSLVSVFKNFGTAMINYGDVEIEFVGARKESYRKNSRKPIVEDGTLEDDQRRRDFTINALAISLNKDDFGTLVDPFDGLKDLKKKLIRTPLDPFQTYSDDPLRMLRAIRFSSQLGFEIEQASYEAISGMKDRITIVSAERIADELNKIVLSPIPSVGFKHLFNTGLLAIIFPEMQELQGVQTVGNMSHKDNFYHTLQVLDNVAKTSDNLWLRWAAILHDIAKPATQRFEPGRGWTFHGHEDRGARMVPGIFRRLKLPLNDKMKYVQKLVRLHLRPIALVDGQVTDSAVRRLLFEAGDDIDDLMDLCEADVTSKNKVRVRRYLDNFALVREKLKEVEESDRIRNWQPPISGEEIIETFNIPPSKPVGDIKNAIREAILEGDIPNNYESAHRLMLELGEKMGLKVGKK
ncbi:MAG: HD domain-containing protein [Flavobacteriales bacterium]|nr:HD domain-containing protein [Flavobacteriales bacterium]